jgi:Phage tail sheath protein.
MKLPSINIVFTTQATTSISRSEKGVVALILRDAAENGGKILTSNTQIPTTLGVENKAYIERAFMGYVNPPKMVIIYVLPTTAEDLGAALTYLETQTFDYLAGPPDITADECLEIVNWIKSQRTEGFKSKAVLPKITADSEAIINFTTEGIKVGTNEYDSGKYCSRIAGMIAGTPMTISCTYALLPEVSDVTRLTKSQMDDAINKGQFILFYDGEKVKVGRGINSLQTVSQDKGESFKKIKIVEAVDMIRKDIKETIEDNYIGKYTNSYDNKCVLISAIKGYFSGLEDSGILEKGTSVVEIDIDAQETYLKSIGIDTSKMSEQEIKSAVTGDKVFLRAQIKLLDAIEDIDLNITI